MLKIQNKTYLTSNEVCKYIAFLQRTSSAYICISYKNYANLLREYTTQEYRQDNFDIININNTYYYNFISIYQFLLSLNLKTYKSHEVIKDHIYTSLMNFKDNLK
jgi:hypothetical protein